MNIPEQELMSMKTAVAKDRKGRVYQIGFTSSLIGCTADYKVRRKWVRKQVWVIDGKESNEAIQAKINRSCGKYKWIVVQTMIFNRDGSFEKHGRIIVENLDLMIYKSSYSSCYVLYHKERDGYGNIDISNTEKDRLVKLGVKLNESVL